ncbi:nitrogen fixation protein NifQ [Vibrio hippocampi]|uniref:Nitrogen fixation protein NifQ n=1 Tax=Vibrio hippocampi TaxID=654686 RepID=A0ABN8DLW5_9VIBR|nr:nitrogen fixation protein NifQ [Vibrio hippocampi]CAH0529329.1 hypothetical protein VHP8226_03165 [Vibrio hippocampi]
MLVNRELDKSLKAFEEESTNHYHEQYYWQLLLEGFVCGRARLPHSMGLSKDNYERLRLRFIANDRQPAPLIQQMKQRLTQDIFTDLLYSREEERDDLFCLLLAHLDGQVPLGHEMAKVLATGCVAPNHLWETLALPDRATLSNIIALYFPKLFAKNNLNMRWKRFFYKQLCDQEGDYVCKAPNCLQCSSFKQCFAE